MDKVFNVKSIVWTLALGAFLLLGMFSITHATYNETPKDPDKKVTITEDCDGKADVEIYGGNTRRTWSVNGDEKWVEFYSTVNWEDVETPVVVQWYHENSDAWKDADSEYTTVVEAKDCPVEETPEATPPAQLTDEPDVEITELPNTGSDIPTYAWFVLGLAVGGGLGWFGRGYKK